MAPGVLALRRPLVAPDSGIAVRAAGPMVRGRRAIAQQVRRARRASQVQQQEPTAHPWVRAARLVNSVIVEAPARTIAAASVPA